MKRNRKELTIGSFPTFGSLDSKFVDEAEVGDVGDEREEEEVKTS